MEHRGLKITSSQCKRTCLFFQPIFPHFAGELADPIPSSSDSVISSIAFFDDTLFLDVFLLLHRKLN